MFVRKLLQPKVIILMLLYTIVSFSFLPFIIWICSILIISLCELIIYFKDFLIYHFMSSNSFSNAPVVYVDKKDNISNASCNIDWSEFNIENYPKVNYRKVYWEHKPFINRGFEYKYPYADVLIVIYIIIFTLLSYIEWLYRNYSLMRALILTVILFIIYFINVSYAGKKYYEEDCKKEFVYFNKR